MKETEIAWTDSTFNPWWGCVKVSEGCKHCYAEAFAKRVGQQVWGATAQHRRFGDKHWNEPLKWNAEAAKSGKPHRVFCASMADVFEGRDEDDADRLRLWRLIEQTPELTWLLLTKRPEHMVDYAPLRWTNHGWPRNVWAGCTVEDQENADRRIPHLLRVPAAVRFLSCEPLLGPVNLAAYLPEADPVASTGGGQFDPRSLDSVMAYMTGGPVPTTGIMGHKLTVQWVIVGGESGHGARPFDLAWARSIVAQCQAAAVPVFVKQMGAVPLVPTSPLQNEVRRSTLHLRDRKGGDMNEWPADLRIRDWPIVLP